MKKLTLITFILFATTFAFAQSKHAVTKATLTYQIKNMGFTTSGFFSGFSGDIKFDKAHLPASSIEASVETKTINSDDDARDEHLRKPDFFDAAKYPKMTIKSTAIKAKGGNNYTGDFELTIKGKTKAIQIPFTYTQTGNNGVFKGSFKINRLDYGVGESSMTLADDVTISVTIETTVPAA